MKNILQNRRRGRSSQAGFTLVELLIGSTAMLVVILGTLFIYMRSNQISVDQQMLNEVQQEVRSSMYFMTRDVRHTGVGIPEELAGFYLEGLDNEDQSGDITPDRLLIFGNMEDPLALQITSYLGSGSGDAVTLADFSFEQYHYTDEYYQDRHVMIIPNPDVGCLNLEVRTISNVAHPGSGLGEVINLVSGLTPDIILPGGILGTCADSSNYQNGTVTFVEVKEFWLDVTGSYSGLTAGENGYIGNGQEGVLYMTQNGYHFVLAQNVENLQFEYYMDFDDDPLNTLDGPFDWDPNWTGDPAMVGRIQQIRISILGRTPNAFSHVAKKAASSLHLYRRPAVANTMAEAVDDMHRRILLQSTVNVRNLTMNIYNTGDRR